MTSDKYSIYLADRPDLQYHLKFSDIMYFESSGNYVKIYHTLPNRPATALHSIKTLKTQLENSFLRISKKHLINKDYIEKVVYRESNMISVLMKNGVELSFSRRELKNYKDGIKKKSISNNLPTNDCSKLSPLYT